MTCLLFECHIQVYFVFDSFSCDTNVSVWIYSCDISVSECVDLFLRYKCECVIYSCDTNVSVWIYSCDTNVSECVIDSCDTNVSV